MEDEKKLLINEVKYPVVSTVENVAYPIGQDIVFSATRKTQEVTARHHICSLSGQFLMHDRPFDPPLRYKRVDIIIEGSGSSVNEEEILARLAESYSSALKQRERLKAYDPLDFDELEQICSKEPQSNPEWDDVFI